MKAIAHAILCVVCVAACVAGNSAPARADFRFCNNTTTPSQVTEGHVIPKKGLTVTGTWTVAPGKCSVIIGGKLTDPVYFYRAAKPGAGYDGNSKLCVMTTYNFTILGEDAPDFRCHPKDQKFFVNGHLDAETMAGFMSIQTQGHSNVVVTENKDPASFHFELK
jgi:uncharacterized membrane protein